MSKWTVEQDKECDSRLFRNGGHSYWETSQLPYVPPVPRDKVKQDEAKHGVGPLSNWLDNICTSKESCTCINENRSKADCIGHLYRRSIFAARRHPRLSLGSRRSYPSYSPTARRRRPYFARRPRRCSRRRLARFRLHL